ncbi:MAG: PspA/IM30 family protein [Myxococcota bacterium]|jgi:phage shock protein A|nr:PspA/IM30 family protein [Myxococcota bacterium]
MAGSGFFARLSNLWSGFVSLWISDVEKAHPEIAYENAIGSMVEKYTRLKKATAAIIRRRGEIDERLKTAKKELAQTDADLAAAIETNQEDLGIILVQKKNQLETTIADLQTESAQAVRDAESAKASLLQVQTEIRRLKAEKDEMLAKMESAQARLRIQEQLDGLSVDAEVKALDNVRQHIRNQIAEADLGAELGENDLDRKLAGLRQTSGEATARSQFNELRAAMQAKKAAQGQKTL